MKICRTYWNAVTRKYGYIERKNLHGRFEFFAIHDKQVNPYPTFGAAYDELKQAGYEPMGFLDETGARRYTMTLPELERVYKAMETFVADCTQQEYNENKQAIEAVLHFCTNTFNPITNQNPGNPRFFYIFVANFSFHYIKN